MTAAAWSRAYRQRQKALRIVIAVEVSEVELPEALVAAKLLTPTQIEDRDAITQAVEQLLKMFSEERK